MDVQKTASNFRGRESQWHWDRATIAGKVRYTSGQRETQPVAAYSMRVRDGCAREKSNGVGVASPHGYLILAVTRRMG